jgi:hypothetical protein
VYCPIVTKFEPEKAKRFEKFPAKISLPSRWREEIFSGPKLDSIESSGDRIKRKRE